MNMKIGHFLLSRITGLLVTSDGSGCAHHMSHVCVPSTANGGSGRKTFETEIRLLHLIRTETIEFA